MYKITDHRGHVHQSDYLSQLIPFAKAMGIRTYFDVKDDRSYSTGVEESYARKMELSYQIAGMLDEAVSKGFRNGTLFIYQLALNKGQLLEDEQKFKEAEIIELFASEIQLETLKNYDIDLDELLKLIE